MEEPVWEIPPEYLQQLNQQGNYLPPKNKDEGIIRFQLRSDSKTKEVIETLMGGYYDKNQKDKEGNPLFIRTGEPLVNKKCIYQLIKPMIDGITGKEVYLSNASDEEVADFWKDTVRLGLYTLWNRKERTLFEIDKTNKDRIQNLIENLVFFAIKRSSGGRTFELLNTQVNVSESSVTQGSGGQPSGWSNLFGGKKQ